MLVAISLVVTTGQTCRAEAAEDSRPLNLVFILADDLGWSDSTLFGTTTLYQTPNLERLARRGMLFSHAYSASPLCSPTRASILSGLSPARIGITAPVCHLPQVQLKATVPERGPATNKQVACESATRFATSYYTLAEALHDAGYTTGHFGKWHLGAEPYDALHQGFDVDVPHWPGPGPAGSYVAPWRFPSFRPRTDHEHIEDRMGDEAVAFIQQHRDQPFYLNYWQFSVHAPFDAKAEYIERQRRRIDPNSPQRSPTYAAMVQSLDENVGKILDTLEQLQLLDRTAIIFFSDNGGNMYNEVDGTTPTSNLPLRGGKATMYEGGIRVPCVVSWPGVTKPGSRSAEVIQSVDFYPTILELLGREPQAGQHFDGVSLAPALRGQSLARDAIFTFFPHAPRVPEWLPPSVAVHQQPWKLIRIFHDGDDQQHRYELYNLDDDRGERHNLAAEFPDRVRNMDARIDAFLAETGAVLPRPNPGYDPESVRLAGLGLSAMNDARLAIRKGALHLTSTGGDPHFRLALARPCPAGPLVVEIDMQSQAGGGSHVYWQEQGVQPPFHRQRRADLPAVHDGQARTYRVKFSAARPVLSIRIDPASAPGEIVFRAVRLLDAQGHVVQEWDFQPAAFDTSPK